MRTIWMIGFLSACMGLPVVAVSADQAAVAADSSSVARLPIAPSDGKPPASVSAKTEGAGAVQSAAGVSSPKAMTKPNKPVLQFNPPQEVKRTE